MDHLQSELIRVEKSIRNLGLPLRSIMTCCSDYGMENATELCLLFPLLVPNEDLCLSLSFDRELTANEISALQILIDSIQIGAFELRPTNEVAALVRDFQIHDPDFLCRVIADLLLQQPELAAKYSIPIYKRATS